MSTQPQSTPASAPLTAQPLPQSIALPRSGKSLAAAADSPERQAHALRNWLTVLRVHCDLLEQAGAVAERHRGWLQELSAAIGRGETLIAGLLPALATSPQATPPDSAANAAASPADVPETLHATPHASRSEASTPAPTANAHILASGAAHDAPEPLPSAVPALPLERKPRTMLSTIDMTAKQPTSLPAPDRSGILHLLVVDDEPSIRTAAAEYAGGRGFTVHTAENADAARAALDAHLADLVLLDLRLPGGGGLALLEEIRTRYPEAVVIVMTAYATVASAVEAMRSGASEYLTKPFTLDELGEALERGSERRHFDLESRRLREKLRTPDGFGTLIGRSPEMERVYRILSKVATTSHPVLILGESGTGKEMVARTIHYNGPNATQPFIPIDCGSLAPTLIESELFGYVKGAFTGANRSKDGLLAAAGEGTVFLDEIGELPLDLQSKLLRALQEKEIRPVGSTQRVPIHARVLAATNRDLPVLVEQGRFRKDLYFRLNVVNVKLPALRERRSDIPVLAAHFLDRLSRETGRSLTLSDEVLRVMNSYDWPGNVRELENMIERACALSSGPLLHLGDLPTQLQEHRMQTQRLTQASAEAAATGEGAEESILTIAEMEKQAILNTIRQLNGDKLTAAKLLGIGKTTLYRKLKEYGIAESHLQELQ
jgi:DNA-binding NtrC family response regulator